MVFLFLILSCAGTCQLFTYQTNAANWLAYCSVVPQYVFLSFLAARSSFSWLPGLARDTRCSVIVLLIMLCWLRSLFQTLGFRFYLDFTSTEDLDLETETESNYCQSYQSLKLNLKTRCWPELCIRVVSGFPQYFRGRPGSYCRRAWHHEP